MVGKETKRETLASFKAHATCTGVADSRVKFHVDDHLEYDKPGAAGDNPDEDISFVLSEVELNNPAVAKAMANLKSGDKVTMSWKHDLVTRDGSSAAERFPTQLMPYEEEDDDDDDEDDSSLDDDIALAQALGKVKVTTPIASPDDAPLVGVVKETISPGDGKTFPQKGDTLAMHYTGTLLSDGTKFDSSRDRGQLFEFKIGVGQVIKGWDEGVMKMSLGERANLKIASDFGYGAAGAGADIPPNADLCFDVQLVKINGQKLYSAEELEQFREKLEQWKAKKLAKYDKGGKFAAARDKKYGDRAGFEAWLSREVESGIAEHQ